MNNQRNATRILVQIEFTLRQNIFSYYHIVFIERNLIYMDELTYFYTIIPRPPRILVPEFPGIADPKIPGGNFEKQ